MQEDTIANITKSQANKSGGIPAALALLGDAWINRYWLVISLVVCLMSSHTYLRYATPQFRVNASLLIRDDAKGAEFGDTEFLESMGLSSVKSSVDNEVEILKSRTLMESVVRELQLNVRYFSAGRLKTSELFDKSPFKLALITDVAVPIDKPITYRLIIGQGSNYALLDDVHCYKGTFGDTVTLSQGSVVLSKTDETYSADDKYSITLSSQESLVSQYRKALTVMPTNKLVSTVNLSVDEVLPKRGEAVLEKLLSNYLKASIDDKNRIADSTITFINKNLDQVSLELANVEAQIEDFQKLHQTPDLGESVRHLMNRLDQLQTERNGLAIHLNIVDSLFKWLKTNPDHIVPAQLFSPDPGFVTLIGKYNELLLARQGHLATMHESHPDLQGLHAQLKRIKTDLIFNVKSQQDDLRTGILTLNAYQREVQRDLNSIPATERMFLELKRQQQIKQDLYTLLLKKRVETSVSKSSTLANARIIDKPKTAPDPIKPNHQLVMLMSGLVGIGLPMMVIHMRKLCSTKITSKLEITSQLSVPVLAEISHSHHQQAVVVGTHKQSQIAEQFRVLRTNILFLSALKPIQVILLTSSMGGEGKSFIAVNLCSSLALTGKKVLLLELDLRKPHLAKSLQLSEDGFTNHIASKAPLNRLIQAAPTVNQFDVITAGTVPPNPAEMLSLPQVDTIVQSLKTQYDYIIIDTPPIGLVTDARLLSHFADISLYVVRQHFTSKHQLELVAEIQALDQLPRLQLIFNDTKALPGYNYTYGYYEQEKRHFWNAFRRG
jgi:capsular exopolysaccharide synthesis family protein